MARTAFSIGLVVAATATVVCSATQAPLIVHSPTFSAEFDSLVDEIRRNASIPGISIGVVRLGKDKEPVVQLGSWGRKTEDGDGHDLTGDTLFGIASCSKAFLATSLGLLMDDFAHGRNNTPLPAKVTRFDYDTKVADILPEELEWGLHELHGDSWATRRASIRDILGHVSGLPRHDYTYAREDGPENVIRRMSGLRTAYELREKWSYNNQMYMLGAHLVSHYSGVHYHEYATERIFTPLKMSSTTFLPSIARRSGLLTDSWTPDGRHIPFWFTDDMVHLKAGAGGIISSADDMVKWLAVWLNEGVDPVSGQTIFPRSVYEAVTTAQRVVYGRQSLYGGGIVGYGMGWMRWQHGGIEMISHTGGIPGFSILTAFSPRGNIGVFIASNADDKASANQAILKHTLDTILGTLQAESVDCTSEDSKPDTLQRSSNRPEPPSLALDAYAGSYTAVGYPPIVLCSSRSAHADQSAPCASVLADFATVDPPSALNASLYGPYTSVWATHVRLRHFSGDVFNTTFTTLFPRGYGRNGSAFETFEAGDAEGWVEFGVRRGRVEGFALVIDEEAVAARTRRAEARASGKATLRETADAWFARA